MNKLKEELEQAQKALSDVCDMRRLKALEKKISELENSLALGCRCHSELARQNAQLGASLDQEKAWKGKFDSFAVDLQAAQAALAGAERTAIESYKNSDEFKVDTTPYFSKRFVACAVQVEERYPNHCVDWSTMTPFYESFHS